MTKLTPPQVAAVAAGAGFTGAGLQRAVAVALAESGGNPSAVGVNSDRYRSRDRGLWQINDHWHPEVSDAAAFNPTTAAAAAFRISKGGRDWTPWATWTNGAAATQLGRARVAVAQLGRGRNTATATGLPGLPGSPPIVPPGLIPGLRDPKGTLEDPLGETLDGFTMPGLGTGIGVLVKAGAWVADPHNWLRVAMVAGGSVGVLLALRMIAESGAAGSTAAAAAAIPGNAVKAATNLVPAGKLAKIA